MAAGAHVGVPAATGTLPRAARLGWIAVTPSGLG